MSELEEFPERFNMVEYFLDRNLALGRGAKVALADDEGECTYAGVHAGSCRAANALKRIGVREEERVLIALPDSRAFAAAFFGVVRAGAVTAMVNVILPEEDYAYYLDYTRASVAFIDAALVPIFTRLMPRARRLRHVLVSGACDGALPEGFSPLADALAAESPEAEIAPTHRDEPAIWLFTSGSTGKPKACVHLHHDLPWSTERYAKRVLGMTEGDRTLSSSKLFFGYATGANLLFPFAVGGMTTLFRERSTAAKIFEMVERHRPTILSSVPTMIQAMCDRDEMEERTGAPHRDISCLRACISAGEALPRELCRRFMDRFGVEVLDGLGSAELFHIFVTNKPADVVPGSLGTLVPGYDARVVGEDERDVAPGDVGALWVRGGSAMTGYWLDHERSKATLRGGWCVSADQVRRDESGRFYYAGRKDDLLKVSGIFVSPLEVEDCLLAHEAVGECCVVPFRDAGDLVKPLAFVVPRAGFSPGAELARSIQEFARSKLALVKYPRRIEFVPDLPKNERGKVERRVLRERVERQ